VHGSGNLVQTLLEQDLADDFSLLVFPLVLGSGKRLFGDGAIPASFKLADVKTSGTGVIASRYERAADLAYGSFAVEEATEVRKRQAREGWGGTWCTEAVMARVAVTHPRGAASRPAIIAFRMAVDHAAERYVAEAVCSAAPRHNTSRRGGYLAVCT
jgi:hypothetical protein